MFRTVGWRNRVRFSCFVAALLITGGGKALEGDHGQRELGALEPLFGFIDGLGDIGIFCLTDTGTGTLGQLGKCPRRDLVMPAGCFRGSRLSGSGESCMRWPP